MATDWLSLEQYVRDGTDWKALTYQRAHLLAATIEASTTSSANRLEGLLNFLDGLSDLAQEEYELFTDEQRRQWWAEGCIEAGLGDPREEKE